MPELPEVETVCRGLAPVLEGKRLTSVVAHRPDLRFPLPPDLSTRMTGQRVLTVKRRAKYMMFALQNGDTLIGHLGMSGRMFIDPPGSDPMIERHDHIVFTTEDGTTIRFNDPRRFGMMDLWRHDDPQPHPWLAALGPEPLSNGFNGPALAAALSGKKSTIKSALLDQKVVAGLGNIYVSEALFGAGISPRRQAGTVQGQRAERLVAAIKSVLEKAIAVGGSSLRDYVQPDGELGYFQHQWAVYGREGKACSNCAPGNQPRHIIKRLVQSGRSTFYCPQCQR